MRSVGVLALLMAAGALAAPPATSAARVVRCPAAKGTTLLASATSRVYRAGSGEDGTFYGCWLATGRRTTLGQALELADNSRRLTQLALAGRYVAFDDAESDGDASTETPRVVDLRTGRTTATGKAVVDEDDTGSAVTALRPTTRGSLVWTGRAADCVGVHAVGPKGQTTLSCGDVDDLAVAGRRAYWLQDGQPRTAVLP